MLFAGLLKHWGTKGPAELPAKRTHTYRQCVWSARTLGIAFQMPPRHPFNPLKVLRLLTGLGVAAGGVEIVGRVGAPRAAVECAFDFIWGEGRDPDLEWPALCERLGVAADTPLIDDPAVKAALTAQTAEACAVGVWGVPTFRVREALFWGADSLPFMADFLADPALFEHPDMRRADGAEIGVERRR